MEQRMGHEQTTELQENISAFYQESSPPKGLVCGCLRSAVGIFFWPFSRVNICIRFINKIE